MEEETAPIVERTYYHPLTGMILKVLKGDLLTVEANAPEEAPWVDGLYDAETQYIDLATLEAHPLIAGAGMVETAEGHLVPEILPGMDSAYFYVYDYEFGDKRIASGFFEVVSNDGLPKLWIAYPGTYRVEIYTDFPIQPTSQLFTIGSTVAPTSDPEYHTVKIDVSEPEGVTRRMAWIEEQRVAALPVVNGRMREIWTHINVRDPWVDIILTHMSVQAYAYLIDPDRDANLNTRYAALVQAQPMFGSTALEVATWVVEQEAVPSTAYLLSIYLNYKNTMTLLSATFTDVANINTLVQNFLDSTEQYLQ